VALEELLAWLGEREIDSVLVEGGGEVAWAFLSQGLVQKLYLFVGPVIIGGKEAVSAVGGEGFSTLAEAHRFEIHEVERLGQDLLIVARPKSSVD
jgi:diaminohydroxyphosphoribosylaminopyrimidine deaminase/5-amino-6-(5-phosphoribosylamino)uracil reductase